MTDMTAEMPEFCWPVDTSCVEDWDAWAVTPNPEADPPVIGVPVYTALAKTRAVALATQTLRMLTLWQVGGCPITVRPASDACRERTWRTYTVRGRGSLPWTPVSLGGSWINIGCGHSGAACGCLGAKQVRLFGPASNVAEVKVDGMVLDPSAYRLDPGGYLVRTDGGTWPLCQDLSQPDTAEGTWSVTYQPGQPVDALGAWAAGVLAGEYVKACTGGQCRLPKSVTQITRQGVTMTLSAGMFPDGKTGIEEVDSWLERWNPNGHTSPPAVYSPDVRRPRRMAVANPSIWDGGGAVVSGGTINDGGSA